MHRKAFKKDFDLLSTWGLLEVYWDIFFLNVKIVHSQIAIASQRYGQALLPAILLLLFIAEVDRKSPPGQGELRGGAESQLRWQFAFNWCGALEFIVDLNTHASSSLFELCWDICCPLCSVCSDLPHLQEQRQTWSLAGSDGATYDLHLNPMGQRE